MHRSVEERELKRDVRRAARGDEDAAAALFDRYYPRLYRFALAKLRDPVRAEDVAAETFARVLRDLDRFRWKGSGFEAWLFRIASNLVVDHQRQGSREAATEVDLDDAGAEPVTPETQVLEMELKEEMSELVSRLPQEQQEVVLLRFAGGLDSIETGRVMNKSPNAIRQLQFRALTNLRTMMKQEAGAL